ncbi:hypothetical protein [Acidovorax sp. FG27]|uniref:hypothetical protein n=1 Tax=Acidovorax sp. FG27 TaxID=3133652 RepID=UPI0030E79507
MPNTLELLAKAESVKPMPEWVRELNLSRNALNTARARGHLSPAIAGSIAEKLGENVDKWIVIAALESEKESACKQRMLKRLAKVTSV